jgi:membrane-bound serine protease (ClpP class)
VGSLILIDTDVPGFGLSIPLILAFAITSALLLWCSSAWPSAPGAERW